MKYAVIGKGNVKELVEAVNGMCSKGWVPQGGLFLTPGGTFAQAMIKKGKEE